MKHLAALVALGILVSTPLLAQRPEPVDDGLSCKQANGGVSLEWNFDFVAPIDGWVINRDGADIAKLAPDASSYFDADVAAGSHVYVLKAINWNGEIIELAKCEVVVEDFGLRCRVDENDVHLSWGPILIEVVILKFRISRNGETIATVPPDQLRYVDTVYAVGAYRYSVHAVTSPDSEFLIGTCSVRVTCFDLNTEVSGLTVKLSWASSPVVGPQALIYLVTRDNELVAKIRETEYKDTVPSPGTYLYQVYETYDLPDSRDSNVPVRIVGACLVNVPGPPIPGPQELTCTVLEGPTPIDPSPVDPNDPSAVDTDGDGVVDSSLGAIVVLKWVNPIAYDKIVIVRNAVIVASLDGSATGYRERVRPGGYHYIVYGIVHDQKSEPAECKVEVPLPVVPPPQDLRCGVLSSVEPIDPSQNTGDVNVAPVTVVVLSWWNPVKYATLIVLRDGARLARLPGDAMGYRDVNPPGGKHVYGVFGVVEDGRRSPTVECEVDVGGPVPPVFNLQCMVDQPTSNFPGSVILVWENAAAYDKIFILRNNEIIFEDTGELRKYRDFVPEPGVYLYCVVAVRDGRRSEPTCCQVVIEGPPRRNLLYFTRRLIEPEPVDLTRPPPTPEPLPPLPGDRITCLADNVDPLQGWSFGVGNDPAFIVPVLVHLRGTATQALNGGRGPDFLHLDILDGGNGCVMAVIIETGPSATDPGETLPPGRGHPLLNIRYAAGPQGQPGTAYPIRYTSTLGDPPVQVLYVVNGFEVTPNTAPGWVSIPGPLFLRADANSDGKTDISDAKFVLDYLFLGGRRPQCMEAANANGSTQLNIADPVYLLSFLFMGGPAPPWPYPFCSVAPAPLGCEEPGPCPIPEPIE